MQKTVHDIVRETFNLSEEETKQFVSDLIEEELKNAPYDNKCLNYAFVLGLFQGHFQEMIKKNKERYLDN